MDCILNQITSEMNQNLAWEVTKKEMRNAAFQMGGGGSWMKKAYDRVEWNFLLEVLAQKGFSATWIGWIRECISTVS